MTPISNYRTYIKYNFYVKIKLFVMTESDQDPDPDPQ
jgi:hypothetical protein